MVCGTRPSAVAKGYTMTFYLFVALAIFLGAAYFTDSIQMRQSEAKPWVYCIDVDSDSLLMSVCAGLFWGAWVAIVILIGLAFGVQYVYDEYIRR